MHLGEVSVGRLRQPSGDDALLERRLVADVHVVEECVERTYALFQTGFHVGPLVGRDDPGNQVEGPDALGSLVRAVYGEGDPLPLKRGVAHPDALFEFVRPELLEPVDQWLIVREDRSRRSDLGEPV